MLNVVECPYCEEENDMTDALVDFPDSNTFDWECNYCENEFEVHVEFEPVFTAEKIEYVNCDECGKSTRDICEEGRTAPFPSSLQGKKVCRDCFGRAYMEELCWNELSLRERSEP